MTNCNTFITFLWIEFVSASSPIMFTRKEFLCDNYLHAAVGTFPRNFAGKQYKHVYYVDSYTKRSVIWFGDKTILKGQFNIQNKSVTNILKYTCTNNTDTVRAGSFFLYFY